jgi:hypothetical protein
MNFIIRNADASASLIVTGTPQGGLIVKDQAGTLFRRVTPAYVRKSGGPLEALTALYRASKIDRTYWLSIDPQ